MTAMSKFRTVPGGKPAAAYTPRHSGVASETRDPEITSEGRYLVKILKTSDSSPSATGAAVKGKEIGTFQVSLEVVETADPENHPKGARRFYGEKVVGAAKEYGEPRVKAFLVAACGCNSDQELDDLLPNHDESGQALASGWAGLWDAASKIASAEAVHGENPLGGRLVYVDVVQGKPKVDPATKIATGGHWMRYAWQPYTEQA